MTEECDAAFRDLKFYLANPPILSRPGPEEDLYMYLVVSDHAMSAVLLRHQDRIQRPVPSTREDGTSVSTCDEKIASLLPSPHGLGAD